jgi:hypothetical protein
LNKQGNKNGMTHFLGGKKVGNRPIFTTWQLKKPGLPSNCRNVFWGEKKWPKV